MSEKSDQDREVKEFGWWGAPDDPEGDARVKSFIDWSLDPECRERVARYLEDAPCLLVCGSLEHCRLCDEGMSGPDYRSDGVWLWSGHLAHYVRMHGVRPPQDFIEHMAAVSFTPPQEVPEDAEVFHRNPYLRPPPESVLRLFRFPPHGVAGQEEQD